MLLSRYALSSGDTWLPCGGRLADECVVKRIERRNPTSESVDKTTNDLLSFMNYVISNRQFGMVQQPQFRMFLKWGFAVIVHHDSLTVGQHGL